MPNQNNIRFGVQFDVDKTSLNQITKSFQDIQKQASKNPMDENLQKAAKTAKLLLHILGLSWNSKLDQLNLDKFNQSVKNSFNSVTDLKNRLVDAGPAGLQAFNNLASSILNTNLELRESNKLLDSMATSMANTVKWGITSSIFNNITSSIQSAYYYAKDLDTSLNNIRIVTGSSADLMLRFARVANNAAGDLGRSTLDYTKAALSFYQQGLSDELVEARTNITLKAQNITGVGSLMVNYLTSVWNGFKATADLAEGYVDKLAKVADSSASDMSLLAIAMSKVAATANLVDVNVDQLTAQLATVIATTRQAPEAVGTAFKTIYSRINDIKTGAEDAEISLGNYSGKMAELGFNVLDASGKLRSTGLVIELIGSRWNSLTKAQQISLAGIMGGQRQITQISALFQNWGMYSDLLNDSLTAQGTLNEKNNVYLESAAAHMKELAAETERTYDILIDTSAINTMSDALKSTLKLFNDFISGIGGGINTFAYFGSVVAGIFNKQIAQGIIDVEKRLLLLARNKSLEQIKQKFANEIMADRVGNNTYNTANLEAIAAAVQKEAEIYKEILSVKKGLTKESYNELTAIQEQIGKNTAKITLIENYKSLLLQAGYALSSSTAQIQSAIKSRQSANQLLLHNLSLLQRCVIDMSGLTDELQKFALGWEEVKNNLDYTNKNVRNFVLSLDGEIPIQDQLNILIRQQIDELAKGKTTQEELLQIIKLKEAYERGDAEALRQQNKSLEQGKKLRLDQAQHVINLQNGVRAMSAFGQAATAIGGALSTALADGATAADKMNAAFAGVNGTVGAILSAIPGIGFALNGVWQGVTSIGKAILQAAGVWDKWEESLKSTEEKLEDIKLRSKKISEINIDYSNSKKSIQDMAELFETLAKKRDSNIKLSELEETRYHELVDAITKYNDDAIEGYNSKGEAIVSNNTLIEKTLELLDKLYLKQMRNLYAGEEFLKTSKAYKQRYNDAKEKVEQYNDESYINLRKENASNSFKQLRTNINASIQLGRTNYSFDTFSQNFKDAYDIFTQINQTDPKKYKETLDTFINSIDISDKNLNLDEQKALSALVEKLQGYSDLLSKITNISSILVNEKALAERELIDASQIDIGTVLGNVKVSSEQYDSIKSSYGEGFESFGELFINDSVTLFLKGLQERIDSGEDVIPESYKGDIINWAVDEVNKFLEEGFSENNFDGSIFQQAIEKATEINEKDLSYNEKAAEIKKQISEIIADIDSSGWTKNQKKLFEKALAKIFNVENVSGFFSLKDSIELPIVQLSEFGPKINKLLKDSGYSKEYAKTFQDWLKNTYSEELITQVFSHLEEGIKNGLRDLVKWVEDFFREADKQEETTRIVENFDKVQSAINKITSGKDLTWKDKYDLKTGLATILGLEDKDLEGLLSNEDWLNKIILKINSDLEKGSSERIAALMAIYPNLLRIKELDPNDEDYLAVWSNAFSNELESLNLNSEALAEYARMKHMAFDSKLAQLAVLATYKILTGLGGLKSQAKSLQSTLKEVGSDNAGAVSFLDSLKELFGDDIDFNASFVVENIDAIVAALESGVTSAEELKRYIESFDDTTNKSILLYNSRKESFNKVTSARGVLESNGDLSGLNIGALKLLLSENEVLAQIAEEQGRYSQEYLDTLNAIIAKQQELNKVKAEELLQASKDRVAELQQRLLLAKSGTDEEGHNLKTEEALRRKAEIEEEISKLLLHQNAILAELELKREEELDQLEKELDKDVDKDTWEQLSKYVADSADEIDGLSASLKNNQKAAETVAELILRYDSALESVSKNYETWDLLLKSGNVQEAAEAGAQLLNVYSDLLGLPFENLSPDFTQSVLNLELLKQAAEGSELAYNSLLEAAYQDLIVHMGIDDADLTQFNTTLSSIENAIENGIDDIEIGASIDNTQAIQAMNQLINSVSMTTQQAQTLLGSMGVDAEVEQVEVPEESKQEFVNAVPKVTYDQTAYIPSILQAGLKPTEVKLPTISYDSVKSEASAEGKKTVSALRVKSANKSSGGNLKFNTASMGAGSRGTQARTPTPAATKSPSGNQSTKQPKTKDYKNDLIDIYAKVNNRANQLAKSLDKVQDLQKKLIGKGLISNLNKQLSILEKQVKVQKEKLSLAKGERDYLKQLLKLQGAKFDKTGNISNYQKLLQSALDDYNKKISIYNKKSADEQEEYDELVLKPAEKRYENLKKQLERYSLLYSELIPELEREIQSTLDKLIELKVQKLHLTAELRLDMKEAARDLNEFKKQFVALIQLDDVIGNAKYDLKDLSTYVSGSKSTVAVAAGLVNKILSLLKTMDQGQASENYGNNRLLAVENLKAWLSKLTGGLKDAQLLIKKIEQSEYDLIEETSKAFSKQTKNFENISDILDHDAKMVQLIYGDKAYDRLGKIYEQAAANNASEVEHLRKTTDFWKKRMDAEKATRDSLEKGSVDWEKSNKLFEEYQSQWTSSLKLLNDKVEESVQLLQEKYANSINEIFQTWENSITKNRGLDYVGLEWELINKQSDMYLDTVNSIYAIEKLRSRYQQEINNNSGNLKAQKSLNSLMENQLKYLRDKDKLSEYDVERANKILDIETKRIALENSRQNKSQLRLKRDSQGSYSYEYTASKDELTKARQDILDALNELYNLTKNAYTNNLNTYYSLVTEWQDKIKQVYLDTSLTTKEQEERAALINKYYGQMINDNIAENGQIRVNRVADTITAIAGQYIADKENFTKSATDKLGVQKVTLEAYATAYSSAYLADTRKFSEEEKNQYDKLEQKIKDFKIKYDVDNVNFSDMATTNEKAFSGLVTTITKGSTNYEGAAKKAYTNIGNQATLIVSKGMVPEWNSSLQLMQTTMTKKGGFEATVKGSLDKVKEAAKGYKNEYTYINRKAKAHFELLGDEVNPAVQEIENLTAENNNLYQEYKNQFEELGKIKRRLGKLKTAYLQLKESYQSAGTQGYGYIADLEKHTKNIPGQLDKIKSALSQLNKVLQTTAQRSKTVNNNLNNVQPPSGGGDDGGGYEYPALEDNNYQELEPQAPKVVDWKDVTVPGPNGKNTQVQFIFDDNTTKTTRTPGYFSGRYGYGYTFEELKVLKNQYGQLLYSFDTGGYTGNWNSPLGKMAVLHEKEIVLNKQDTKNILSAVNIVRSIDDVLKSISGNFSLPAILTGLVSNISNKNLDQNVHIEAHFPNVTKHSEIEEAFNNLVNQASQYVNRH